MKVRTLRQSSAVGVRRLGLRSEEGVAQRYATLTEVGRVRFVVGLPFGDGIVMRAEASEASKSRQMFMVIRS